MSVNGKFLEKEERQQTKSGGRRMQYDAEAPRKTPKRKYPRSYQRAAIRDKTCDIRGRGKCPVETRVPSNLDVVLFMRKRALI